MAKLTMKELAIQNHALALRVSQLETDLTNALEANTKLKIELASRGNRPTNPIRALKADFMEALKAGKNPVIVAGKLECRA